MHSLESFFYEFVRLTRVSAERPFGGEDTYYMQDKSGY